jgi:hypothetical protein
VLIANSLLFINKDSFKLVDYIEFAFVTIYRIIWGHSSQAKYEIDWGHPYNEEKVKVVVYVVVRLMWLCV